MRASTSADLPMMLATYGLRFLVVVFTIAAAATFLHVNNYRPSKCSFCAFSFAQLRQTEFRPIFPIRQNLWSLDRKITWFYRQRKIRNSVHPRSNLEDREIRSNFPSRSCQSGNAIINGLREIFREIVLKVTTAMGGCVCSIDLTRWFIFLLLCLL